MYKPLNLFFINFDTSLVLSGIFRKYPEKKKNNGIWKIAIKRITMSGGREWAATISIMAIAFAVSMYEILVVLFIYIIRINYCGNIISGVKFLASLRAFHKIFALILSPFKNLRNANLRCFLKA